MTAVRAEPTEPTEPTGPIEPAPPGPPRRPTTVEAIAAAGAAGAGLVHAAAAGSHGGDTAVMWLFACTAAVQLGWAATMLLRPGRGVAFAGAVLNGATVLAWMLSRTVGLTGPLAGVEPVGTQDLLAAALGTTATLAAALAVRAWRHPGAPTPARGALVGVATVAVLALAVPGMAAEHSHGGHGPGTAAHGHGADAQTAGAGHGDAGDHGHAAGTGHGNGHATDSGGTTAVNAAATTPILAIDDPRLTPAQRSRAAALLVASRTALARFPDEAAVVAAGYRSIGDGRTVGSFEHFVHGEYLRDGREVDPSAIESIVMQRQADGTKRIASAMYILEPGRTMANVPEVAGSLTTWHDHQNLCWNDNGRLAGILRDGVCVPGGTFRPTPPMLHVWIDDPVCGPFTGVEGHGGADCSHDH